MLSRYRRSRAAISTQIVAVVVVVVIIVAGVAGYLLLTQAPNAQPTTTAASTLQSGTSTAATSSLVSTTSTPANSPINIGVLVELSGSGVLSTGWTDWVMQSLAAKQINDSGGVMGHPLNLIKYDTQLSTSVALEGARVLDQQDNVLLITGTAQTDDALAVHGYVESNGVPFIVPVAASPDITAPGSHWSFRLELNAVGQGAAIGKYMADNHPGSKVAIVTSNVGYFRQEAAGTRYIMNTYTNDSMSIVYDQFFPNTQSDWTAAVAAIKLTGANIIEYNIQSGVANFNAALLSAGYTPSQIFSTSAASTLATTGASMLGMVGQTFGDETSLEQTANGTAFVNEMTPILQACVQCLNGAKFIVVSQGAYYDYISMYFIAAAAKSVLQSGQPLTRQNFVNAMHTIPLPKDPNGYPQYFDQNGAMQGPPFYVEKATQYNATTQKYHGVILGTYQFGASLPVYNITQLPTT